MPPFEAVWSQYTTLCERLRTAAQSPMYAGWAAATSGTVIMKVVFTVESFYSGCEDYERYER